MCRVRTQSALVASVLAALVAWPAVLRAAEVQAHSLGTALSQPVGARYAGSLAGGGSGSDTLRTSESFHKHPFWFTALDIVVVNEVIWAYNRYIREGGKNPEFRVGWRSLEDNLRNGFEWDDNNFETNHFLHPYHGSLYFTGARANGYSYYESIPFTFMGSWMWEYWGEVNNPSINDWIVTSVSGIALGECLTRLSGMVLDNTATGSERAWREIGGFFVAPVRGFTRLVTGEAFEVHQNPSDRIPEQGGGQFKLGLRWLGEERLWRASEPKAFLRFQTEYGDPFGRIKKPFDHFKFVFQLNFDNSPHTIGRIEATGILAGKTVHETERTHHRLAAYQHFDMIDNEAFTFGNQAISATYMSSIKTKTDFEARTEIHANAIILGAAKSDYFNVSGREYDYGIGVGYKLRASFGRHGRDILKLGHDSFYIQAINGNNADHYLSVTRVSFGVPVRGFFRFDVDYLLYLAERHYAKFPDVSTRNPELRISATWDVH